MYDADGALLYVGISLRALTRMRGHKVAADWWDRVAMVKIEKYPDRASAMRAEMVAIGSEQPAHNRVTPERKGAKTRRPEAESERQALIAEATRRGVRIHKNWCAGVLRQAIDNAALGAKYPDYFLPNR